MKNVDSDIPGVLAQDLPDGRIDVCFDPNTQPTEIVLGKWQLLVVTGEGESTTSSFGRSNFYVGDEATSPQLVGTADRVACGSELFRLGVRKQGPGALANALYWDRLLSAEEIDRLWHETLLGANANGPTAVCPRGTQNPDTAQHSVDACKPCSPGRHSADVGSAACAVCPSGSHCPSAGAVAPINCPAGHFCPEATAAPFPCK
jgi:hypothetical protein